MWEVIRQEDVPCTNHAFAIGDSHHRKSDVDVFLPGVPQGRIKLRHNNVHLQNPVPEQRAIRFSQPEAKRSLLMLQAASFQGPSTTRYRTKPQFLLPDGRHDHMRSGSLGMSTSHYPEDGAC